MSVESKVKSGILFLAFFPILAMIAAWQQQNFPGGSSGGTAGTALNAVYNISTSCGGAANCLQWVDDDSTDNCGAATTAFMATINAAALTHPVNLYIGGGGVGKFYLLKTCDLEFFSNGGYAYQITANANFDAGSNSGANIIQFGDGTHGDSYTWTGGTFIGGASLTVAGMEVTAATGNARISDVKWVSFGSGNATLGNCTNYAIKIDNPVAETTIERNLWSMGDGVTGRCFAINAAVATAGQNTALFLNNVIGGQSGSFCASQGIVDGGYYGMIQSNNIGNLAVPIRIQGFGHRIDANQLDTEGCTASGINAVIQYGAAASAQDVDDVTIINNVAQFGALHATNFFQQAGNSTATISNVTLVGNSQSSLQTTSAGLTNANLVGGTPNCNTGTTFVLSGVNGFCYEYGNLNLAPLVTCGAASSGWQFGDVVASCQTNTSNANVPSTALLTTTNSTVGTTSFVVTCQVMLLTADTTSSTLPQCEIVYTDNPTNTTQTLVLTPVWASGTVGCSGTTTNTVGNSCQGTSGLINPKKNTAINYQSINYANSGSGTHMVAQLYVTAKNAD